MSTFKAGDKIWHVCGNSSEPVEFVRLSDIPMARYVFADPSAPVRTFPRAEPAAVIRQSNGQELLVLLADLFWPQDDPNKAARSIVDRATRDS